MTHRCIVRQTFIVCHNRVKEVYSKELFKNQIGESCQAKVDDKKVCTICKKFNHTEDTGYQNKVKSNVVASVSDMNNCPLSYQNSGKQPTSKKTPSLPVKHPT